MQRFFVLIAALGLVLAACGGAETDAAADDTTATVAPVETLPPNPAAGACLAGSPDCQDIPGGEEPILPGEPVGGADPTAGSSGMLVGGGLTIADALAGGATGTIAVQGFVVADADGIRLCEALAESMPPQCGGASIGLSSLDVIDPDSLRTEQGVTWSDGTVSVLGELVDGTLVVDPLSA